MMNTNELTETVFSVLDETKLNLPLITDASLPVNYTNNPRNQPEKIRGGLFDELIFGTKNDDKYRKTFACIELDCFIPKPFIYFALLTIPAFKSARNLNKIIIVTNKRVLDSNEEEQPELQAGENVLFSDKFYNLTSKDAWNKFLLAVANTESKSAQLIKAYIDKFGVEILTTNKLLVIPPIFRDFSIQDRKIQYHEINIAYANIFNLNEQIKGNKSMYNQLLKAYNIYLDLLVTKIGKKEGMLRQKLATKVLNTTTRSVIVPRDDLKEDEIGIPFVSLCNMYQAELIHALVKHKDEFYKIVEQLGLKKEQYNLDYVNRINSIIQKIITSADKNKEPLKEFLRKLLEKEILPNAVVVFKRDPVIHRSSWLAARPVIARQNAIEMNNLYCAPLGGDYDGDSVLAKINIEVVDKKNNNKVYKFDNISIDELIDLEIK